MKNKPLQSAGGAAGDPVTLAGNPEAQKAASLAVRSLAVISTLCRSYNGDHPVLIRAVQMEMSRINAILDFQPEFTIYFIHGGVWWETLQLDGGNRTVVRFAQLFAGRGIIGITLRRGVSPDEIRRALAILILDGQRLVEKGLQALLDEAGIRNFIERKEKVVMVGETPGLTPAPPLPTPLKGFPAEGASAATPALSGGVPEAASVASPARHMERSGAQSSPGGGVWHLEAASEETEEGGPARPSPEEEFRQKIRRLTDGVLLRRLSPASAADQIIKESDGRMRVEMERHLALLKNMRDVMLAGLEQRRTAAILTDLHLNVLAMNAAGRKALGVSATIGVGTPLHEFLMSGREQDRLSFEGADWEASQFRHAGEDEALGVVLVLLDPVVFRRA